MCPSSDIYIYSYLEHNTSVLPSLSMKSGSVESWELRIDAARAVKFTDEVNVTFANFLPRSLTNHRMFTQPRATK